MMFLYAPLPYIYQLVINHLFLAMFLILGSFIAGDDQIIRTKSGLSVWDYVQNKFSLTVWTCVNVS